MTSINTNPGAEIALRVLSDRQVEKEEVQEDVSTGKEVDKAKDSAAIWAISEIMGSDLGQLIVLATAYEQWNERKKGRQTKKAKKKLNISKTNKSD